LKLRYGLNDASIDKKNDSVKHYLKKCPFFNIFFTGKLFGPQNREQKKQQYIDIF
jgi:hypothetical protein